jgi:hypothetical protein
LRIGCPTVEYSRTSSQDQASLLLVSHNVRDPVVAGLSNVRPDEASQTIHWARGGLGSGFHESSGCASRVKQPRCI